MIGTENLEGRNKMECAICSSANISLIKRPRTFTGPGQKSATVETEMYKCNDCCEEFFNPAQAEAVFQKCREAGILLQKS